jgi:hypothetical protein
LIALGHEIADYYAWQMAELHPRLGRWTSTSWVEVRRVEIARDFAYSALGMAYGAGLMVIGLWRRSAFVRWQAPVLIAVAIVKVFIYDVSELDRAYRILSFIVLGVLLLAISFVYSATGCNFRRRRIRFGRRGDSIAFLLLATPAIPDSAIPNFTNVGEVM